MARATITGVVVPDFDDGAYNLTDSADYTTLSTGSGNGAELPYASGQKFILKNDTGGNAVFTIELNDTAITAAGGTVTDPTMTVATGKEYVVEMTSAMKQADGKVYVDCDVAGKVLLLY